MNYASIRTCDIANGDGVRVTLFVSGCTHRCKGCFNPDQWDFDFGEPFTREVEDRILKDLEPSYLAGLSILGGEPMEPSNQRALVPFLRRFRETFGNTKTLWVYTGCMLEELRSCEVEKLGSCEVEKLRGWEVEKLGSCEVEKLGSCEVEKLRGWEVERLGSCEVEKLGSCEVEKLRGWEVEKLGSCEVEKLRGCPHNLTTSQPHNFTTSQPPNLPTSQHSRWRTEVTDEFLSYIDVLVDGPFVEELKDISLQFRGSSNQRIIRLRGGERADA